MVFISTRTKKPVGIIYRKKILLKAYHIVELGQTNSAKTKEKQ